MDLRSDLCHMISDDLKFELLYYYLGGLKKLNLGIEGFELGVIHILDHKASA